MKKIIQSILSLALAAVIPAAAQAPASQSTQLLNLVGELGQNQTQMEEAQTKTETKVNDLAEAIRTARLLMSRAGGPHRAAAGTPSPPPKSK